VFAICDHFADYLPVFKVIFGKSFVAVFRGFSRACIACGDCRKFVNYTKAVGITARCKYLWPL